MAGEDDGLRALVAEVSAAYLGHARVGADQISEVIRQVQIGLTSVGARATPAPQPQAPPQRKTTAEVRRSVKAEGLVSFEDGRRYTSLTLHLRARGLTPDAYRQKHGLPADYPMVSAAHSAKRSEQAKSSGFGRRAPLTAEPVRSKRSTETPAKRSGAAARLEKAKAPRARSRKAG